MVFTKEKNCDLNPKVFLFYIQYTVFKIDVLGFLENI